MFIGEPFLQNTIMKNVIVTGASKGIGYHTALALAVSKCRVLAVARNVYGLDKLKAEECGDGLIEVLQADITKPEGREAVANHFEKIDGLINNAGILIKKPFDKISFDDLQKTYDVNVFSPFLLTQKCMPKFNPFAHIINIGSVGGVNGTQKFPGLTSYSSSKAAISCLSECLQAEFENKDISFNSLALGSVQTEMLETAFPGYKAGVNPNEMGRYIADFALDSGKIVKGKTQMVSNSNP